MRSLLMVGAGGCIGSVLRYLISGWVQTLSGGSSFPFGTLGVNVGGCLVIGFLGRWTESLETFSQDARLFLFLGLLGGFTTFSTFGYENWALLSDREWGLAGANVLLSNLLGLTAVWLGNRLAVLQGG